MQIAQILFNFRAPNLNEWKSGTGMLFEDLYFAMLLLQNKAKLDVFGWIPSDKAWDGESSSGDLLRTCFPDKGREERGQSRSHNLSKDVHSDGDGGLVLSS